MQAAELPPQTNILAGFGESAADANTPPSASNHYLTATPDDIAKHRFTMGTVLLGNGFYDYDLKCGNRAGRAKRGGFTSGRRRF